MAKNGSKPLQVKADSRYMRCMPNAGTSRPLATPPSLASWLAVAVAGTLLLGGARTAAEEPESPRENPLEELFLTDVVYPQEQGEWQFTLAPNFRREQHGRGLEVPISIEYGISDAWQIELEWTAFHLRKPDGERTAGGIGDLELGTQYSFLNLGGSDFHLAPRLTVEFPLGDIDRELTEGFVDYEPSLILARDFPSLHHLQVFTQIGLSFVQRAKSPEDPSDREPAAHQLRWSSGMFLPFDRWVTSLEVSVLNNRWNHDGEEHLVYLAPGFTWRLTHDVEVGIGVPIGLNRQSDRYQIISSLVFEF